MILSSLLFRVEEYIKEGRDQNIVDRALTEDDIPGASLRGRSPATLKNEELRFWLKCRGDKLKGLKTKAQLVKR